MGFELGPLGQELVAIPTELSWLDERNANLRQTDSFYYVSSCIFADHGKVLWGRNEGRPS